MAAFIHITDQATMLATSEIASIKGLGKGAEIRTKSGEAYRVWASPCLVLATVRMAERRGLCDIPLGWGEDVCAEFLRDAGM